jgi:hypothetical protein
MSLLTEIKLKLKDGTHNTTINVRLSESVTVLMCVTYAIKPCGINLALAIFLLQTIRTLVSN